MAGEVFFDPPDLTATGPEESFDASFEATSKGAASDSAFRRERALQQQRYLALSTQPGLLGDHMLQDAQFQAEADTYKGTKFEALASSLNRGRIGNRNKFEQKIVDEYNNAVANGRQGIPDSWWLEMDPLTVELLGTPESAELAEVIHDYNWRKGWFDMREGEIKAAALETYKARQRISPIDQIWSWVDGKNTVPDFFGVHDDTIEEITAETRAAFNKRDRTRTDQLPGGTEKFRIDYAATLKAKNAGITEEQVVLEVQEEIDRYNQSNYSLTSLAGKAAGAAINVSLETAGQILSSYDQVLTNDPNVTGLMDVLKKRAQDDIHARVEEMNAGMDRNAELRISEALVGQANDAWNDLENVEGGEQIKADLLAENNGDEIKSMAMFSLTFFGDKEARDQMSQYLNVLDAENRELIDGLREFDFQVGKGVLDAISWYGVQVPMRFATAATLLMTDADMIGGGWTDSWQRVMTEVEKNDFSPSRVLGIDGSLMGLAYDMGMGVLFDPVTFFFAPRGALATVKPFSDHVAMALGESMWTKQMAKDIWRFSSSGERGAMSSLHMTSWMDSYGQARLLEAAGYKPRFFELSPWRDTATGKLASVVNTRWVEQIGGSNRGVGKVTEKFMENLRVNGLRNPIEVTISRSDGGVHLSNGSKRLAAYIRAGEERIPVVFKLTDKAHHGSTIIPGFTPEEAEKIAGLAARPRLTPKAGESAVDPRMVEQLIDDPTRNIEIIKSNPVAGEIETPTGHLTVYRKTTTSRTSGAIHEYWAVNPNTDRVVTAAKVNTIEGANHISTATSPTSSGENLQAKLWDFLADKERETVPNPILMAGNSETTSIAAQNMATKYAQGLQGKAVPTMENSGTLLTDLLGDQALKKELESFERGVGDKLVRPDTMINESLLWGNPNFSEIEGIIKRQIMQGGIPDGAHRTAFSHWWLDQVVNGLRETGPGKWVDRFTGSYGTTTAVGLSHSGAGEDVVQMLSRIWHLKDDAKELERYSTWIIRAQTESAASERVIANRYVTEIEPMVQLRNDMSRFVGDIGDEGGPLRYRKGMTPEEFMPEDDLARIEELRAQDDLLSNPVRRREDIPDEDGLLRGDDTDLVNPEDQVRHSGEGRLSPEAQRQRDALDERGREMFGSDEAANRELLENRGINDYTDEAEAARLYDGRIAESERADLYVELNDELRTAQITDAEFQARAEEIAAMTTDELLAETPFGGGGFISPEDLDAPINTRAPRDRGIGVDAAMFNVDRAAFRLTPDASGASLLDDPLQEIDNIFAANERSFLQSKQAVENQIQGQAEVLKLDKQIIRLRRELDKLHRSRPSTAAAYRDIMHAAWREYNIKYIGTNPVWRSLADADGFVPWEHLRKGRPADKALEEAFRSGDPKAITQVFEDAAKEEGITNPEKLFRKGHRTLQDPIVTEMPLSPLEMLMARELGGAAYTRATSEAHVAALREVLFKAQNIWITDKVLRPSTAAVASTDELLRIFSFGGIEDGMAEWAKARGVLTEARIRSALTVRMPFTNTKFGNFDPLVQEVRNPLSSQAVRRGSEKMRRSAQQRIRRLGEVEQMGLQVERQLLEIGGLGWGDVTPTDANFVDQARRMTGGLIKNNDFKALLKGRDEYIRYVETDSQADFLRRGLKLTREGGMLTTSGVAAGELYDGQMTLFKILFKNGEKEGRMDDILRAFQDASTEATGTRQLVNVPDWVFNYMGPVRGIKKLPGVKGATNAMTEKFFEKQFLDPANFRRGLLAKMVRHTERARIKSLLLTQGYKVVSDLEVEVLLGMRGAAGSARGGLRAALHEEALKHNMYLQSMVDEMVERTVRKEIENQLFQFDMGSRFGTQLKPAVPFVKPYADMIGNWSREVMRRPVARGWFNHENLKNVKAILESLPLNPKPAAFISRLAATDFSIDKGLLGGAGSGILHEGGVIPGSDETDFSPLFFLPTGGQDPIGVVLPGVGFLPIFALDLWINEIDPVDDPLGWQQRVNAISEIIPAARFQQGGLLSRVLGGGVFNTALSVGSDFVGGMFNIPQWQLTSMTGDISREIDRTREMSAQLLDDDVWAEMLELQTMEEVELWMRGLAHDADIAASKSHAFETGVRFVVPANAKDSSAVGEIMDVWVHAGELFPDALTLRPSLRGLDLSDSENRRAVADEYRRGFFKMSSVDRNILVAQYPQMAINMVGSWEWSPKALAEGIEGTDSAYRSGGSALNLALHNNLVTLNYIRPLQLLERTKRIIGTVEAARQQTGKQVWRSFANQTNDILWQLLPEMGPEGTASLALLEVMATTSFAERWGLSDARDIWENWGILQPELEKWLAGELQIDPVEGVSRKKADLTAFDLLRKGVQVPGDGKAIPPDYPGNSPESLTDRAGRLPLFFWDEQTQQAADAVGIPLTRGMSGAQLFNDVANYLTTSSEFPVFHASGTSYRMMQNSRSAEGDEAMERWGNLVNNPNTSPSYRTEVESLLFWEGQQRDFYRDTVGYIPLNVQEEMVDRFSRVVEASTNTNLDFNWVWETNFERTYGPLDWRHPEPPAPIREDGTTNPNAMAPFIVNIPDGDSIVFKDSSNGRMNQVRLLGVRAADYGSEDDLAAADEERLYDAIIQGIENGDTIWLVRDPALYGNTDNYGRMLAYLWIGDTPYFFPEDFRRNADPSEDDRR